MEEHLQSDAKTSAKVDLRKEVMQRSGRERERAVLYCRLI